jgi:hypothetical protein
VTDDRKDDTGFWSLQAPPKAVLAGLVGLIGAITGLIQIEEWITSVLWAFVRLTLIASLFVIVVLWYRAEGRRRKRLFACISVALLALLGTVAARGPTSSPQQHSREAWAKDVNHVCGKYVAQMGKDYNTIRIAGVKVVERSQKLQKYKGDPNKGIRDYLEDLATLVGDSFPAYTRTDSNYRTIENEIGSLTWPTRATDEKLARSWWNMYRERTKKFAEVYIAAGNYLINNPIEVRIPLLAQYTSALVAYKKVSDDFYSQGESLGVENCR